MRTKKIINKHRCRRRRMKSRRRNIGEYMESKKEGGDQEREEKERKWKEKEEGERKNAAWKGIR